ncbi:MAG: SRPBCC domain-containing protein [Acidimicrobiales bacterium]
MTDHEIIAERLTVSRHIPAPPDDVFAAWTQADLFVKWWGPVGVTCIEAVLDVGVGKTYRIGNQLPDGTVVWISGRYLEVRPSRLLRYTWAVGPVERDAASSIVIVEFSPAGSGTDIVVTHERIESVEARENHLADWLGCLAGLVELFDRAT